NYLMRRRLRVGAYWPLALLLVIPYVWWTVGAVYDRPPCMLGVVRSAIIALLALALMEPAIHRSAASISVAYLLDVSQSVAPADIQSAIQWIHRTNDSGKSRPLHSVRRKRSRFRQPGSTRGRRCCRSSQ